MNENIIEKVFTQINDNINIEGSNLSINCITNPNNNFSLDSEGNLIVNSITVKNISSTTNFDEIYPVGSIYLSINNTNPSTYFGGSWERIANGRTLVGVDESDNDFITSKKSGGSKYLQAHTHAGIYFWGDITRYLTPNKGSNNKSFLCTSGSGMEGDDSLYTGKVYGPSTGNSGNLQPYLTCYIWQRIS